jgi:hypothetical protein
MWGVSKRHPTPEVTMTGTHPATREALYVLLGQRDDTEVTELWFALDEAMAPRWQGCRSWQAMRLLAARHAPAAVVSVDLRGAGTITIGLVTGADEATGFGVIAQTVVSKPRRESDGRLDTDAVIGLIREAVASK